MSITTDLFKLQDPAYKEFHCRLMPNVEKDRVIGVRTPALRAMAKRYAGTAEAENFLKRLPHHYYEEMNFHGALIEYGRYDYEQTLRLIEEFLPYIDNWATCDMFVPSVFKKHKTRNLPNIRRWLKSEHPYTIRFGINCLMRDYLDTEFDPIHFEWVAEVRNEDYYVKMGIAWYYSVALVKQWDITLPQLQKGLEDPWIQNKSIQKAIESDRITAEQKALLRQYKIK